MNVVLSQLNGLPGVVGSMVCTMEGRILGRAFPPVFEPATIDGVARLLVDGADAIQLASEQDDLLDLRFREVRLLVRPFSGTMLAVLCSRTTNLQRVVLSMAAAVARLEKAPKVAAPAPAPPELVAPAPPGPGGKARVAAPTKGLDELRRRLATLPARAGPGERRVDPPSEPPQPGGPPARRS